MLKFSPGDRVYYIFSGAAVLRYEERYHKRTIGTVVRYLEGSKNYQVRWDDDPSEVSRIPGHKLALAKRNEENTMAPLIGPKPEPAPTPTVTTPFEANANRIMDANGKVVARVEVVSGDGNAVRVRRNVALELVRLLTLGLEADQKAKAGEVENLPVPKFRLRSFKKITSSLGQVAYEVEPGHIVYGQSRESATRQWEDQGKSIYFGQDITTRFLSTHAEVVETDAPEYVLRQARDHDNDRWFEVKPGRWIMADNRQRAEAHADSGGVTTSTEDFPYKPLKIDGTAIPEHQGESNSF